MPLGKVLALMAKSRGVAARKTDCFRGKKKMFSLIGALTAWSRLTGAAHLDSAPQSAALSNLRKCVPQSPDADVRADRHGHNRRHGDMCDTSLYT